jgi:hypothetical protein
MHLIASRQFQKVSVRCVLWQGHPIRELIPVEVIEQEGWLKHCFYSSQVCAGDGEVFSKLQDAGSDPYKAQLDDRAQRKQRTLDLRGLNEPDPVFNSRMRNMAFVFEGQENVDVE